MDQAGIRGDNFVAPAPFSPFLPQTVYPVGQQVLMMLRKRLLTVALLAACALPAHAGTKEQLIQLQTSVDNLQAQMQRMQQAFDERMGVMKNLIDQTTDNVNKMNQSVDALSHNLQTQQQQNGQAADQVSAQIQQMHDSVDELKARIAKVSKQLEDFQAQQQNLQPQPGAATPGATGTTGTSAPTSSPTGAGTPPPGFGGTGPSASTGSGAAAAAPPPDVLYNNALRDYNGGRMDLASQEFSDYLRFYPTTDLAGNAQFYLAEIMYRNGDYANAVKQYDRVLEQYPGGSKAAAAQLKKGYALIELGQKDAGIRELRALTIRYPKSIEAQQAKDRLHRLGVNTTASAAPRRR
jgi:tol-pal system protein YbgF